MKEIIQNYLDCLEQADYKKLMSLFEPNAMVYLSANDKQDANGFYKKLFQDIVQFKIKLINISANENKFASVYFHNEYIFNNNTVKAFDALDIFEFNDTLDKIAIIYLMYPD